MALERIVFVFPPKFLHVSRFAMTASLRAVVVCRVGVGNHLSLRLTGFSPWHVRSENKGRGTASAGRMPVLTFVARVMDGLLLVRGSRFRLKLCSNEVT